MIKVLYLLLGISLKQLLDEIKSVTNERIKQLEKNREIIGTYRSPGAILKGTPEAAFAEEEHRYKAGVAPELKKIGHKIRCLRLIPLVGYLVLTSGLLGWIVYLEWTGSGVGANP